MDRQLDIMVQSSQSIAFIKSELDKVSNLCMNHLTISASNRLYNKTLEQAKATAFDNIKGIIKPYVVYQVNKYFNN